MSNEQIAHDLAVSMAYDIALSSAKEDGHKGVETIGVVTCYLELYRNFLNVLQSDDLAQIKSLLEEHH